MKRITPSFAVAVVALVCAMAGTSYAAAKLSGSSIKKRSLPANRVVADALTGTEVNEATLGQVPSAQKADTATAADSATTAADAAKLGGRSPSDFVPAKRVARIFLVTNVAVNNGAEGTAQCLPGEVAISGGGAWYLAGTDTTIGSATLSTSAPALDNQGQITGWRAEGKNTSAAARDFRAWVVCATA